jgi:hypothetical protein
MFKSPMMTRYEIKNLTIILANIEYSFSFKNNITEIKYQFNFYDNNNLIVPSNLTLLYDLHIICNMKDKNDIINFISLANIYENKYFYCTEFFNINEKMNFGIKIFKNQFAEYIYFFSYKQFNYNDLINKKENKFAPLIINKKYIMKTNKIFKEKTISIKINDSYNPFNGALKLKKLYIINPIFISKTNLNIFDDKWSFQNIYNHYFCLCKGPTCYPKISNKEFQKCKYKFYLSIIDENRNIYNKTDYLFGDFFYSKLSSDDTYPIFEEMLKNGNNVHYITQNRDIILIYIISNYHYNIINKKNKK